MGKPPKARKLYTTLHKPVGSPRNKVGTRLKAPSQRRNLSRSSQKPLSLPILHLKKKSCVCSHTHPGGRKTLKTTQNHEKEPSNKKTMPNQSRPRAKSSPKNTERCPYRQRWSARHTLRSSRQLGLCLSS